MIGVSEACSEALAQRRDFRLQAQVTLADGTELALDGEDFTIAGNALTDGAGSEGLPLGAAVCRQVRLRIMNDDGHLDGYDFFGAKVRLWLTLALEETTERVELGTFTAVEPASLGETVAVSAWDDMYKTDRPFETDLTFPATLGSLYREICQRCGIPYSTAAFPNEGYAAAAPEGEVTFRQVLGWIALLAGGNARVDRTGRMQIIPYAMEEEPGQELADWSRLEVGTDDIVVTGMAMGAADEDGGEVTALYGTEGYVLQVEDPLVPPGGEEAALALMGAGVMGVAFRPFQGTHAAWPLAEFMDMVWVRDRKGRRYKSVLTDVDIAFGGYTSFSNSAQPAVRNASRYVTPEAAARQAARKLVERERTARQTAVEQLYKTLAESGGLYSTVQKQEDGSAVYYLHDKPTLAASGCVMKLTAQAIGLSVDGGKSWPFGFTVTGEMVMGIIQAEGLNADWVKFGTLDQARVEGLAEMASGLEVLREQITAAVTARELSELETALAEQVEAVHEQAANLTERADQITGTVSDIQQAVSAGSGEIQRLQGQISALQQTASALALRFDTVEVDHVTTSTGYTFDANGLDISKAGEQMHNQLTNLGMYVRRDQDVILKADAAGVEATDVRVNNFLLLGRHARFEDYNDGTDGRRTACYFVD